MDNLLSMSQRNALRRLQAGVAGRVAIGRGEDQIPDPTAQWLCRQGYARRKMGPSPDFRDVVELTEEGQSFKVRMGLDKPMFPMAGGFVLDILAEMRAKGVPCP